MATTLVLLASDARLSEVRVPGLAETVRGVEGRPVGHEMAF